MFIEKIGQWGGDDKEHKQPINDPTGQMATNKITQSRPVPVLWFKTKNFLKKFIMCRLSEI